MKKLPPHAWHSQTLPLLAYAENARIRALPLPACQLARRHGLPPSTALAVANAAGFNCGGDR